VVLAPNQGANIPEWITRDDRVKVRPTVSHRISAKRNAGLFTEDADYYGCLDSDSYPQEDWLERALETFQTDDDIVAVGGPNLSPSYETVEKRAVAASLRSVFVTGPRVFTKRSDSATRYVEDLQTCNLIFDSRAISFTRGFDEALPTGEDTDICHRLRKGGFKILFSKDVVVHHHNRPLWSPYIQQKIVFGYAVPGCLRRKFEVKHLFMLLPFLFLIYATTGWLGAIFSPWLLLLWVSTLCLYLGIALLESFRFAAMPADLPHTLAAMVLGNISPGIGTAMALLDIPIHFQSFYVNYHPNHRQLGDTKSAANDQPA